MQQPSYIVFQCYGYEAVFLECAFSLMSLSGLYTPAELSNTEIWIYTDKPEWFDKLNCPLPIYFRKMDAALIKQWRGKIDFVHRVKIELLLDFTQSRTGNVLYADTDMVFLHPLGDVWSGIDKGELYMHIQEGKISERGNPIFKKLDNYLRTGAAIQNKQSPLYDMDMWNAGVLGFNTQHRHLLTQALAYTDSEYPRFPKHIVEQFAFSIQFQTTGNVKAAMPYMLHYWNMKEMRPVISSFLEHFKGRSWNELTRYSRLIQPYLLVTEKNMFIQNRSLSEKVLNKKWQPAPYNWLQLEKQM